MPELDGKRVLLFVGTDYEDLELWYPKLRLEEAGAEAVMAGQEAGATYAAKHGYPAEADIAIDDANEADFDGLVIPGGWMPDKLRRFDKVKQITRDFDAAGKLVASICHGGWIVQSAGICEGRKMTSTPGIKDDLEYAGAQWSDEEVVVDGNFVSSRRPGDLPAFMRACIEVLANA
ncbi:MAG: type 1 glutamine amidotransferase domain-containing protein [Phycisphaeraceae bacterium]|nr:type 1 glutamine amidotransferase domain-containing protein [Phycisphaeraceae bacterium]